MSTKTWRLLLTSKYNNISVKSVLPNCELFLVLWTKCTWTDMQGTDQNESVIAEHMFFIPFNLLFNAWHGGHLPAISSRTSRISCYVSELKHDFLLHNIQPIRRCVSTSASLLLLSRLKPRTMISILFRTAGSASASLGDKNSFEPCTITAVIFATYVHWYHRLHVSQHHSVGCTTDVMRYTIFFYS
jgi:hypothetical protein